MYEKVCTMAQHSDVSDIGFQFSTDFKQSRSRLRPSISGTYSNLELMTEYFTQSVAMKWVPSHNRRCVKPSKNIVPGASCPFCKPVCRLFQQTVSFSSETRCPYETSIIIRSQTCFRLFQQVRAESMDCHQRLLVSS